MFALQINRKSVRFIFIFLSLIFIAYYLFFSDFGYLNKWKLEREKKILLNQIKEELERRDSLEMRIKLLESDSLEIEKVAREKYGLVKEGEEVYAITKKKEK
ncbi:MAG: hypothetical protein CH6_4127 [Candidatus Kapaibacterium sp.]|nr:MAG: hypothetical protein CH6_4127 [Candidatus Kapabacteria bacterium]